MAVRAGFVYFVLVFTAGFLLGTLRVLVLEPLLAKTWAVLIEIPLILAVSWIVCRRLIAKLSVSDRLLARLTMGGVAFAFLLVAEIGLSVFLFGRTLFEHLATYRNEVDLMGLAGQFLFALLPVIQSFMERGTSKVR